MSVAVMLQAWGWVSVVWLVTVHLLIRRGRLPQHGPAYQVAGSVAAISVVAASAAEDLWPVAVLGLLWLRVEVFGHRHPVERRADRAAAPMPEFLVGALDRGGRHSSGHAPEQRHPEHPHHLPHPHLTPRAVDRVFKVEMGIVIVIAVVLFGIWADQNRHTFTTRSNYVVCNWVDGC
jgi:hypothetical protein